MVVGTTKGNAFVELYVVYLDESDCDGKHRERVNMWSSILLTCSVMFLTSPVKEVEIEIELVTSTAPITVAPYRMTLKEIVNFGYNQMNFLTIYLS